LVPQAIIGWSVAEVVGNKAPVIEGYDDLDSYVGASFKLDDAHEISVRRYRGYPPDTATIYMDPKISDVEEITSLIRKILAELNIPISALRWERRDGPDL